MNRTTVTIIGFAILTSMAIGLLVGRMAGGSTDSPIATAVLPASGTSVPRGSPWATPTPASPATTSPSGAA